MWRSGSGVIQFGEQLQILAVEEDGVVSDERNLPADGRRSDPEVADVLLLVQGTAKRAAVVAEPAYDRVVWSSAAGTRLRRRRCSTASRRRSPQPAAIAPYRTSATVCCATVIRRPNTCLP